MRDLLKYLKDYKKECVFAPLFKALEAGFELIVPTGPQYRCRLGYCELTVPAGHFLRVLWRIRIFSVIVLALELGYSAEVRLYLFFLPPLF